MNVCGKALPPKAATLLGTNIVLLVIGVPFLLTIHSLSIASGGTRSGRFTETLGRLVTIGLFCQVVFYYSKLYNLQIARHLHEQLWRMFGAIGTVMLFLAIVFWMVPDWNPGRDALLGLPLASVAVLVLTRSIAVPKHSVKVALIGPEPSCASLRSSFSQYPEWNLEVVGSYPADNVSVLSIADRLDRIIVSSDAHLTQNALHHLINLKMLGIRVESAARFLEQATGRVQLDEVDPEWFVFSEGFENSRRKLIVKRCFDLVIAGALLFALLPVMVLLALAIILENKGPLFYRQDRVGLHGGLFRIFKFRTMIPASPNSTPQWTANHDKRITRLGQIMRTFRLDELPQLINILKGDMSLVGPRPEQPYFCELLAREIPFYHQRHTIPPGLTGWAQVRYMYGASIEESKQKLEFDLFYVKNLSMWLDLAIAFETLKVVIAGQGAK
jgi:exopolysaccharide biosynthesis polyprenyl glycosylphosphotransferase